MSEPSGPSALVNSARRLFLRGILYAVFISLFLNFVTFAAPLFMMHVYERVIPSGSYDTLYGLAMVGLLAVLIFGLLDFVRSYTYIKMSRGVLQKTSLPALEAAVRRSLEGGVAEAGGTIRDLNVLKQFIAGNAISTPIDSMCSLLFIGALYILHPVYGYMAAILVVVMIILNVLTDRIARPALNSATAAENDYMQNVAGSLRHSEVIEAMGMLPALIRRWRNIQENASDSWEIANVRTRAVLAMSKAVQKSVQMIAVGTGAILVLTHEINTSVLFAGMVLTSQAISPFLNMIESYRSWVEARNSWTRTSAVLHEVTTQRQSMPAPVEGTELVVRNLVYIAPGRDAPVLRGVSFSCSGGDVLGVAGPSGAGKSALARALVGITRPTAGGAYLDGNSTYLWERGSFGRGVGYLPQSLDLMHGTIREIIARMENGDPRHVIKAAQAAQVHDLIGRLPHGYDTVLSDGKHMLSGGQVQRIALARALYGDPMFLVLDEPNSNLDADGESALVAAIKVASQRGAIVILIAHRPSLMSVANKILVLENGAVRHFGPADAVLREVVPAAANSIHRGHPEIRVISRKSDTK